MKHKLLTGLLALGAIGTSVWGYGQYHRQQAIAANCCESPMATCTGSKSCNACKNCKYCKHCAKEGKSCGVCKK